MTAVWVRARAELRARWRAWIGLALMMGILAGSVFAAAAGARRTSSAYPRFLKSSNAMDVMVPNFGPPYPPLDLDAASRLQEVKQSQKVIGIGAMINNDASRGFELVGYLPAGPVINRPKIIQGRLPRADSLDEIAVSTFDQAALHARVGGTIHLESLPTGSGRQSVPTGSGPSQNTPAPLDLRVVGIVVSPADFPTSGASSATDIVSPALASHYQRSWTWFDAALVRTSGGAAGEARYEADLERTFGGGQLLNVIPTAPQTKAIERSFHLQAVALWILAGLAGLTMVIVFGQILTRQVFIESSEFPTMRALGMTRADLVGVTIARGGLLASTASVVALIVAYVLSTLMPIGTPRLAEPHPGLSFDVAALLLGVLALIVVVIGLTSFAGWRLARSVGSALGTAEVAAAKPSVAAGALARSGMPPAAVAGVRLALEPGHGRTALPVRTTLVSVAVGLAALVAAVTFSSSLHHLLATPSLYGVGWDTEFDSASFGTNEVEARMLPVVRSFPGVQGIAIGGAGIPVKVEGVEADALAFEAITGEVIPPAIDGRLPGASREIALGRKTLQRVHKRIGDFVSVTLGNGFAKLNLRIVGTVVVPPFGATSRLGEGSILSHTIITGIPQAPPPNVIWVRFSSSAAKRAAIATMKTRLPDVTVYEAPTPSDIVDFGRVRSLPFVLAGLLGLLSAATLAHAIVTAIRRRRRDLAILKTLGFVRGQVRRAVAWQASALAVVAMIVALPVGVVVGRSLWSVLATQLGIRPEPTTPLLAVLLTIPATMLLAIAIALLPARAAARTKPALVLRTE